MSTSTLIAQFQDDDNPAKINSPFSRFGLGDISPFGYAGIESSGGLFASFQDPYSTNIINPASLPSLAEMGFEIGLYANNTQYSEGGIKENNWAGNIDYIGIAFPTKNILNITLDQEVPDFKHGMSLSLSPYSLVGYDILDTSTDIGGNSISDSFEGRGGTYRFLWGNGFQYKNLSIGLNIGYLFGNIEQQRSLTIDNVDFGFGNILYQKINIRGFQWNIGAQYSHRFDNKNKSAKNQVIIGVYGNSNTNTTLQSDEIVSRGRPFGADFIEIDTISIQTGFETKGKMPAEFGFGASYYKTDPRTNLTKLRLGFNFSSTSWSKFILDNRDSNLDDGWQLTLGGEYLPFANAIKYRQRIRYRIGLKFATDPRIIQGEQLKTAAVTLGAGLPLILPRGKVSLINLSLEIGKINSNNSIDAAYGRLSVGFTLNDNTWFLKRKIN
ncbi:MAG: hypothetical protein KJP00_04460 [Bacteroidia bacterium]|nr:hypothetical protein [Bacteroidia bacterium]